MNPYLEALEPKLTKKDYEKLCAIDNPNVHEFIAKGADLCHAEKIFICSDSAEDIAHVRRQAIASGEEKGGHRRHRVIPFTLTESMIKDEIARTPSTSFPEGFL